MKRRSRYSDKVIAFALAERRRGVKWKEIVDGIRREFGIKPPTERQMRDWYKELGGGSADPERLLRENLIKVARATTPIAAFTTQKFVIEQVPTLVEAWKQGRDPWIAGGVMILSMLEQTAGTETFDKILDEYQEMRKGKSIAGISERSLQPQPTSDPPLGWMETEITSEETEEGRKHE